MPNSQTAPLQRRRLSQRYESAGFEGSWLIVAIGTIVVLAAAVLAVMYV